MRASLVGLALLLVLGPSACSNSTGTSSGQETGAKHYAQAPPMTIDASKTYTATIATPKGTITLSLDPKAAPVTVNNFVFLARDKFYDGLTFHRVEPGFVIQGGDPVGTGKGGPGYTILDEPSGLKHIDGALAMAKSSEPNSAGSQFYITLGAQPSLDGKYTVFGAVTSGQQVVRSIVVGDTITSVTIAEK
jgi:cyclophilin family peptidyl-prolyl cis-trans isomerase